MSSSGFVIAALLSCAILAHVAPTQAKKDPSPPVWKDTSMPYNNVRFKSHLEGSSIKLDCKAQGHPKPTIKWMKDGVPIRRSTPGVGLKKFFLIMNNVTADMKGNYSCLVENKHGIKEWSFILDIQARVWPLVVEGPSNITQMVGSTVAFQCRILNDPKATIRWQRLYKVKGQKRPRTEFLPDGDDPQVLMLENVQKEDEGEYRCMVGNIEGIKYSAAWLTIIEPVTEATDPPGSFGVDDNSYYTGDGNNANKDGDIFGQPYDRNNPNIFDFGRNYYTTTKRPRKNKKNKKNGRKKNKKNKKATRPPTTTPLPTSSSESFWWTDSTPSTPSTFNFWDTQRSTFPTKIWNYPEDNNDNGMVPDTRYNPRPTEEDNAEGGKLGSAKDKDREYDISTWKIYTIVGALGGVVLLIGLIAITIALCCPKQEGAVYKSTPV